MIIYTTQKIAWVYISLLLLQCNVESIQVTDVLKITHN